MLSQHRLSVKNSLVLVVRNDRYTGTGVPFSEREPLSIFNFWGQPPVLAAVRNSRQRVRHQLTLVQHSQHLVRLRLCLLPVQTHDPDQFRFITLELHRNVFHQRDPAAAVVPGRTCKMLGKFALAIYCHQSGGEGVKGNDLAWAFPLVQSTFACSYCFRETA